MVPLLRMGRLRPVESHAQGGSAGKCWRWDFSPGTLAPEPLPGKGEKAREEEELGQGAHLVKS